jgi:hypothetical protein
VKINLQEARLIPTNASFYNSTHGMHLLPSPTSNGSTSQRKCFRFSTAFCSLVLNSYQCSSVFTSKDFVRLGGWGGGTKIKHLAEVCM